MTTEKAIPPTDDQPTDNEGDDSEDRTHVTAHITTGDRYAGAQVSIPIDSPLSDLVVALLSVVRGTAAAHSTLLGSMVTDQLTAHQNGNPKGLTLAALADIERHYQLAHGVPLIVMDFPGLPAAVPIEVVRAVLLAAGAVA